MPCLFLVLCMFTCYRPVLILVPFAVTHSHHGQTYIQCFYTSCFSLWCATPLCSTLKQRKATTHNRHSIELHANSNIIRHPSTLQRMPTFHLQSRFSGPKNWLNSTASAIFTSLPDVKQILRNRGGRTRSRATTLLLSKQFFYCINSVENRLP